MDQLKDKIVQMSMQADQQREPIDAERDKHEKELEQLRQVIQVLSSQLGNKQQSQTQDMNVQTTLEPIKPQDGYDTISSSANCSCKNYQTFGSKNPNSDTKNPYKRNAGDNSARSERRSRSSECGVTSRSPPIITTARELTPAHHAALSNVVVLQQRIDQDQGRI